MSIIVSHGTQSATLWLSAYYTGYNYLTLEDYMWMPHSTDTKKPNPWEILPLSVLANEEQPSSSSKILQPLKQCISYHPDDGSITDSRCDLIHSKCSTP